MTVAEARASWRGGIRDGQGDVAFGRLAADYSYASRWESGAGTNPEELLGAAHAACYSMSLAIRLTRAGFTPTLIETVARVTLLPAPEFRIAQIVLAVHAVVADVEAAAFAQLAEEAKHNCPVSKALAGVEKIELETTLERPAPETAWPATQAAEPTE